MLCGKKIVVLLFIILFSVPVSAAPVDITILHTNDFHGQLQPSGSNPGAARVAHVINDVRTSVGAGNVLLVDAGDEMQGSLLSNLFHGSSTIDVFNAMGYDVAAFGNHDFDWGQTVLTSRVGEAAYSFVAANIVMNDTGNCSTAGWTTPSFAQPYIIKTVGVAPNQVNIAFVGVTSTETPFITIAAATVGLCFKDPADSILHYYDAMKSAGADVIVVVSHLGYADGGYGYGIPVYGDQTLAKKLIDAGKPVPLIIGGHTHTNLAAATVITVAGKEGQTSVVQAHYNGRAVGRADLSVDPVTDAATVLWQKISVSTAGTEDATVKARVDMWATDPGYVALVNQPIGYSAVDLPRNSGRTDNMMGTFIDDAVYHYLNSDGTPDNDIDIFLMNAGGIRTDWCYDGTEWVGAGCTGGLHAPGLLTYGDMFTILPFGNATVVGTMTGTRILEVLNKAPLVSGVIQPAGLKYKYYGYRDANPGPQPYAWGAFDVCVIDKTSGECGPLDLDRTYRVGTNEFLAPAGGDGYSAFKYMTDISYWGDMLNTVNAWVAAIHGTEGTAYAGPNGDGTLDGRIVRDGTDAPDSGSIIPITILHHNDSHGNLFKGTYVGHTQLATLIKQQRAHNPARTLLLNAGDQIQGDALMYYFKSAPSGFAADGSPLPVDLQTHPMIAVMNSLGYDAMTLGNHEFNFGSEIFMGIFGQAQFSLLGANVSDSGAYGLSGVGPGGEGVRQYIEKDLSGIKVAILGIANHRVPDYELQSNIPGLTFTDPLVKAQELSTLLRPSNDVLVALTHIGFTENPGSIEVDTNMAATIPGLDVIVGGHSHTDPSKQTSASGEYLYLPTIVGGPDNIPVLVSQAYRYNSYLGELIIGVRAKAGGGYEVASRTGQYFQVTNAIPEDLPTKAIVDPYLARLNSYTDTTIGQTTVPIDALQAFTQETNAANLQADASVFALEQKSISVDFHLSGAMTNRMIAPAATPSTPVTLKVNDIFSLMPYENSLVVLNLNGPQLKQILERSYRNYYYYKYVPGYGGYSYYTTCMLDINSGGRITYNDLYPDLPSGNNVLSLSVNGQQVDFSDASTYYRVSTVNYLASGSCNFNNSGVSLWPLAQIVHDTQYYVRDAVIDFIRTNGTVSPAIEGRIETVHLTPQTITVGAHAPASAIYTEQFTVSAAATSGLPVSITTSGSCSGGGISSAVITMTNWSGSCTIQYNQTGDSSYLPASQVTETTLALPLSTVSLPPATGTGTITLTTSSPGCSFIHYATKAEADVMEDPLFTYPYGLVEFTLSCTSADVSITFPGSIDGTSYRKYGPTTPGNPATTHWYSFTNVTMSGSNTIVLHLQDGHLGDDTGVDGIIVGQGGAGQPFRPVAIPAMTDWGIIIFVLLSGGGAVYYIRRQTREER